MATSHRQIDVPMTTVDYGPARTPSTRGVEGNGVADEDEAEEDVDAFIAGGLSVTATFHMTSRSSR
jgi:hypothetical protein